MSSKSIEITIRKHESHGATEDETQGFLNPKNDNMNIQPPNDSRNLGGFNKNAVLAVAFYWVTSLSLVFLNKTIMDGDITHVDAPLFMSWTQFAVTVICCAILGVAGRSVPALSRFPPFEYKLETAGKVLPLTFVFLGMIVFNNLCLKYVQVSFYQVARSLTILFNVAFSFVILGTSTTKAALFCVAGICVGYWMGCDGEVKFSWAGVIFGGLSSMFVALYSIYVKKILPLVDDNSERLMMYNNLNACFILPFFILLFTDEWSTLLSSGWAFQTPLLWVLILVGGVFGFLINFASFIQIQFTSPLSHNVSGTAKAAAQTLIAIAVLGNKVETQGMIGIFVVLAFSFAYARTK